jgi:hypothetical protein
MVMGRKEASMRHHWRMNVLDEWHSECPKCGAKIRVAELSGGPRGGTTFDVQNPDGTITRGLNRAQLNRWKGSTACQEVKR